VAKMKDNEKVMSYIPTSELGFRKSPHPVYQILKPLGEKDGIF